MLPEQHLSVDQARYHLHGAENIHACGPLVQQTNFLAVHQIYLERPRRSIESAYHYQPLEEPSRFWLRFAVLVCARYIGVQGSEIISPEPLHCEHVVTFTNEPSIDC